MCASAWTAFTTARIAAKPAKFPLPTVVTEPQILRLLIDADARLAAAAGGAAHYLADAAGLDPDVSAQLQSSVTSVCVECFDQLKGPETRIEVSLTRFCDRLEVALSTGGGSAPVLGLDAIAGFAIQASSKRGTSSVLAGVDRVQYETRDGGTVTRLTKYLGQLAPKL